MKKERNHTVHEDMKTGVMPSEAAEGSGASSRPGATAPLDARCCTGATAPSGARGCFGASASGEGGDDRPVRTVILAAGMGKRMHSPLPKALHTLCGKSMLAHVADAARSVSDRIVCVVGHGRERILEVFDGMMDFAVQEEQLGTGHAVKMAEAHFGEGDVLVLFADTPLVASETLRRLVETHRGEQNAATLITAIPDDPSSFGRIVRKADGSFLKIVEYKNADEGERQIREVNSGMAVFRADLLREKVKMLSSDNPQGEYLLTDVFEMLLNDGEKVGTVRASDFHEMTGINDKYYLSLAEEYLQRRIKKDLMLSGVTVRMPETVYIESGAEIEPGAVIEQGSRILAGSKVASDCVIGPFTEIKNVSVGEGSVLIRTVAADTEIGSFCHIGPFAYLRPGTKLGNHVKIGDFVELKNTTIGDNTKVPHLSYLGDGEVGARTNIGCGTIFVNYDGMHKHKTSVGSDSFVGCASCLVAPVRVGDDVFVAAGTTVVDDVDDEMFVISRVSQTTKPNKRARRTDRKEP